MVKKVCFDLRFLFFMLLVMGCMSASAQKDTTKILIPVKNRVVNYEQATAFGNPADKAKMFKRALKWCAIALAGEGQGITRSNKIAGTITGKGLFRVITSDSGNYYWLRFDVIITITDNSCVLNLMNFYEKPIEKGISNEYSKIEYRWGDFKRGKPWSSEDDRLFRGINSKSVALLASFKKEMESELIDNFRNNTAKF